MHQHDIVPPIQPMDFIDDVNLMQQAAQVFPRELRQENIEIKKDKNNQDVLVVIPDPKPVTFDLEKDLAMKEKRRIKGKFVEEQDE